MGTIIVFYILAAVMIASSILAVTTRRMMRAATYLLFALIGTAGFYLLLNYHFLAAVQVSIYAGGVIILFLFAIMLTSAKGDMPEKFDGRRMAAAAVTALAGIAITAFAFLKHEFLYAAGTNIAGDHEINMKAIGHALMGTEKYQFLLPFEMLGILLLVCAIGAILIARKR